MPEGNGSTTWHDIREKLPAKALTYKKEDILDIEKEQRNKLKSNQVKWQ